MVSSLLLVRRLSLASHQPVHASGVAINSTSLPQRSQALVSYFLSAIVAPPRDSEARQTTQKLFG